MRFVPSINLRMLAAMLAACACAAWIAISGISATQHLAMEEKRTATRHLVEVAHGILTHHAAQVSAGRLSDSQARTQALEAIRALRYEQKEYFWINDMRPRMVMHPTRPELDGQDLSNHADPSGKPLFKEFVRVVTESKGGFVDYLWPKPGQSTPVPKVSYVKGFEPWGWIIGSGIYVDDVQAMVTQRAREQGRLLAGMVIALLLGGWLLRRSIVKPLDSAVRHAQAVAAGKLDETIDVDGPAETRRLLSALQSMQSELRARIETDQRVRQALDASSVPVRIVDNEGRILFLNQALRRKLAELEPEIRCRTPGFDKDKLIGGSIGIFYPNPDEALARLRTLTGERRSVLEIGGRHFDIVTNPIVSETGERLGSVGEWVDRHDELRAEKRLSELIESASHGDFSGRVALDGLNGFHLVAAQGINRLMDQVSGSLSELATVLRGLAKGHLDSRMSGEYHGIFSDLQADMNESMSKLAAAVGEIRITADAVRVAAQEIAQGNTDLSTRTEQQATSLEHTSSSMNELISTVRHTTQNTQTAHRLAAEASGLAEEGGETVERVVRTMAEIGDSSRRVEEIISVINGIAFQTNILALNAAVEAARAGEQGRGFAVVATEVRTLAQRSAAAAQEIRGLIASASDRVDAGAALVQTAGSQMQNIVSAVRRVTEILTDIARDAGVQSTGIERVSGEVRSMDEMTQQNAALVEQAAAAAESLEEQSAVLATAVSVFRLERA